MTAKRYILYKHTAPNGKVYIGITCKTPLSRWGSDGSGYKLNPYFWKAIRKHGWNNFKHEILLTGLSKEEACEKEREYIALYHSNNREFGYNMTSGGETGYVFTEEVREKISSATREQWARMSPEEKRAFSQKARESDARRTPEERKAISEKAQKTIRERYTPEQRADRYRRAVETRKRTMAARGGYSPEQRAAHGERMRKYWEEYHRLHPKEVKKKRYYPPRTWITMSIKQKWQDPEYIEKQRRAAESRRGVRRTLSEETKAKMRKPKSEATKVKMRKPKSMETRLKMSEAKKRYFANMTAEQREAFANKFRKQI